MGKIALVWHTLAMDTTTVKLDPQNRVVLPRRVREDASIASGAELVAIVEGPGRILLVTRDALVTELQDMFAGARGTEDLLAEREADADAEDERMRVLGGDHET